jgi:RNA-directed DNA polymerase
MPKSADKPFKIPKQDVMEAFTKVKRNKGGPGVDGITLEVFESDLKDNLYKVWNRLSSGTYFPPAVRAVDIPKPHGGGVRTLGIPTVADRVAQTVVAMELEKRAEKKFHRDSYGYRPGRSPLHAVEACRDRCFENPWVLDIDIEKFFDSCPHEYIIKAVEANTDQKWVVLYVRRWLEAPVQRPDGTLEQRKFGTPQGSAISPLLANLYMHYAFDVWMEREFPKIPFERFCDDIVVHCVSERQTRYLRGRIAERLAGLGLRLHPEKTKIVFCKNDRRPGSYEQTSFTFLGYTFRPRGAWRKAGGVFNGFQPAVSKDAMQKMSREVRSWRIHRKIGLTIYELAAKVNEVVRGWMNY